MLEVAAHHGGEQPGADDVVPLRAQVVREHAPEQVGVVLPAAGDLRRQRRRRPRVHDVGVGDETARHAALLGDVALGHVAGRVDGKRVLARQQRGVVVGLTGVVQAVPEREGDAEEALPADQPVAVEAADPVLVARAHERRVPVELAAALDQRLAQVGVAAAVAHVPLAAGDDLERAVALLVELHRVRDGLGLAEQLAGVGQQLDDALLRLLHRLAGQLGI